MKVGVFVPSCGKVKAPQLISWSAARCAIFLNEAKAHFDLVKERLADLDADSQTILAVEVFVFVIGFDVEGVSVERGEEVVLCEQEAIGHGRDGVFEEDAAFKVLDVVIVVATEGDLVEDDARVLVADGESDLFGTFEDILMGEIVERAACSTHLDVGFELLLLSIRDKDAGACVVVLGETLLEVDIDAVDGAVVADDLDAAQFGIEVSCDKTGAIRLNHDVKRHAVGLITDFEAPTTGLNVLDLFS